MKISAKKSEFYLNNKQMEMIEAPQKIKAFVAGRGVGKSVAIGADDIIKIREMPRAKICLASTTYNQLLTKTLPAMISYWTSLGFRRHEGSRYPGHFIVGKRPPNEWTKPYIAPEKYQNCVTWWNGYTIEMVSMDRADLARGGSYDGIKVDEAGLCKRHDITQVLLPGMRGNKMYFDNNPQWQQMQFFTSMPWKQSGKWVLDYEELAREKPLEYKYVEGTAYDNIDVLGERYIELLRSEMPYHEFMVEVMNERMSKLPDGFYHNFNDDKHCYTPAYNYGNSSDGITVTGTKDIDPNKLLDVSCDFGGWINVITIFQERGKTEYLVDSLFVKNQDKIEVLVDNFCSKYEDHKCKHVRLWGEPRGHDNNPLGETFYRTCERRFVKHGWRCEIKASAGRTNNHEDRYLYINNVLAEDDIRMPKLRINQDNNKSVIIAIQSTAVTADSKKDKSKEKDRNFPQENAPHFTDTIDYYFFQKHKTRKIYSGPGTVTFS